MAQKGWRAEGDWRQRSNDVRNDQRKAAYDFFGPTELGYFSEELDDEGTQKVFKDKRQMKFLRLPPKLDNLSFDLNCGYEVWLETGNTWALWTGLRPKSLESILDWALSPKRPLDGVDVVCARGLLTRIASSPYEKSDGWKCAVVRIRGVYFLSEYPTDDKIAQNWTETDRATHWGYKFEQYMVAEREDDEPSVQEPIKPMDRFKVICSGRLGGHRLLFAGEVDCFDATSRTYVELKTNRIFSTEKQELNFYRYKSRNLWLQSFLVGIQRILVGFRDDDGFVRSVKSLDVSELARDRRRRWEPSVCFNFLGEVLDHVRKTVTADDPARVYLIEWKPGEQSPSLVELKGDEAKQHYPLPDWFLRNFT